MKIVVDYLQEKNDANYHNNIRIAVEITNREFATDAAYFVNFPIEEVDVVLSLIKEATKTGIVTIFKGEIIYMPTDEDFKFVISGSNDDLKN